MRSVKEETMRAATRERRTSTAEWSERMSKQLEEIYSPLNVWGAGEEFGHSPTSEELFRHYVRSGGAERFAVGRGDNHLPLKH